jgi:hypothetical protein
MPFGGWTGSTARGGAAIVDRPAGTGRRVGIGALSGGATGARGRGGSAIPAAGRDIAGATRGAGEPAMRGAELAGRAAGAAGSPGAATAGTLGAASGAGAEIWGSAAATGGAGAAATAGAGSLGGAALDVRLVEPTGFKVMTGSASGAGAAGRVARARGAAGAGATGGAATAVAPAAFAAPLLEDPPRRTPRTMSAIGSSTTLSWFFASSPSFANKPIRSLEDRPSSFASSKIRTLPVAISSFSKPGRSC